MKGKTVRRRLRFGWVILVVWNVYLLSAADSSKDPKAQNPATTEFASAPPPYLDDIAGATAPVSEATSSQFAFNKIKDECIRLLTKFEKKYLNDNNTLFDAIFFFELG